MTSRTVDATTQTLGYDRQRRLTSVDGPAGDDFGFVYDADGTRVARTGPDTTVVYVGAWQTTDDGDVTVHYRLAGRRVGHRVDDDLKIVFVDQVGSTAAVYDVDTATVDRLTYMPYGLARSAGGHPDVGSDRLYTGQHTDP